MPTLEAVARARVIHMVQGRARFGRVMPMESHKAVGPCRVYDVGKCATFSSVASFSRSLRVRLWVRQMVCGGSLRGVSYAAESTTRPHPGQADELLHSARIVETTAFQLLAPAFPSSSWA